MSSIFGQIFHCQANKWALDLQNLPFLFLKHKSTFFPIVVTPACMPRTFLTSWLLKVFSSQHGMLSAFSQTVVPGFLLKYFPHNMAWHGMLSAWSDIACFHMGISPPLTPAISASLKYCNNQPYIFTNKSHFLVDNDFQG